MFKKNRKKSIILVFISIILFISTSFRGDLFEIAKQIEIFTVLFKTVNVNYVDKTNPGDLMDKAIKNMLTELDPYTVFFNEQDVVKFRINTSGEYTGIGALMNRREGRLIIVEPYKNYAADKAGLKAGDEIVQIGDVNVIDFKEDVSQLFKGTKNTKIDIKYQRQGNLANTQVILDEIEIKAVPFFSKIDDKTGYIVLSQFNEKASSETKEAVEKLKKEGVEKLILDLRGNPGGLLNEAVAICNIFVPKDEIIVTTKAVNQKYNNTYRTTKEPIDIKIPLVILVDGNSASASEIVAGALQDLDRAVILGTRSFGKGLVQRPLDLTYGTQVKITISRYYTPSGRCIQALDYLHKDNEGKAIRTSETNYAQFKTRKGRNVYDGGGIQPDIELAESKLSTISSMLLKVDVIFNFATQFYYKNPSFKDIPPTITDQDYIDFKKFFKKENFLLETETEGLLKKVLEVAKKEKIDQVIATSYQQLMDNIQKNKENDLNANKEEIKKLILEEVIKRFRYKEGLYEYYIENSLEIKKAKSVLSNSTEYYSLLDKK